VGRLFLDTITEGILTLFLLVVRFVAWTIQWSVALVVFLLVMAGAGYYVYTYALDGGHHVVVPQVSDLPITDASFLVAERGLELATPPQRVPHATVPKYHVISQRPESGKVVRSGRKVYVTVSMGADFLNAPELVNRSLEEARNAIELAGFRIGSVARIAHSSARDTVISQDPPPGRSIPSQGSISLLVSQGTASQGFLMPDIRGKDVQEVIRIMEPYDVILVPNEVTIPGAREDEVLDQQPPADTLIYAGDTITYDVKASGAVELPDTRHSGRVSHVMPYDWYDKSVRVEVVDRRGNRQVVFTKEPAFDDAARAQFVAGTTITVPVNYIGDTTIEFYVNGQMIQSYLLKDGEPPRPRSG